MNRSIIFFASLVSVCLGALTFCYLQGWILFAIPFRVRSVEKSTLKHVSTPRKTVIMHYWSNNSWKSEGSTVLWTDDRQQNIYFIVSQLLTTLYDEGVLEMKLSLESVMISPDGQECFMSFNETPLPSEYSIFKKWMIIESILKTIFEYDPTIAFVRFLVHHEPLSDCHLDFSCSWPIVGFLG